MSYIRTLFNKVLNLCSLQTKFDVDSKLVNIDRLEMQTALSRAMGHEFRNVLSVILGYSEVLLMREQYKDSEELQTILEMSRKGLILINQTKGPVGDVDNLRPPITAILRNNVELFMMLKKNINISCWFNATTDISVNTINVQYIEQILLNLLMNASQAVTANNGKIFIEYFETDTEHQMHFHDTGIGIPNDKLNTIFELFYTTKGKHGTGIGLAVTLNLVKQLEGTIHVENKDWTTFTVCIPK